jgi:7-cyano-7-deazaguanine synthase
MAQQVVVIYSGGMDSFTVLSIALEQKHDVYALSFDYGQRHKKELDYAARACAELGVQHKIIDISPINQLIGGSSLTSDIPVAEGHYEEQSMKSTVVPNRNMILLSMAVGYAVSLDARQVYYGAHSGDHAIYPDCRPEFVKRMNEVCAIANYEKVEIVTPFLNKSKTEILAHGIAKGLDYNLSWTCYNGREKACGKCGACQERLEAFAENQVKDPLEYE